MRSPANPWLLPQVAWSLVLGLLVLAAPAHAEEVGEVVDTRKSPLLALDFNGSMATLQHPAAPLPANPAGFARSAPDREATTRVTLGVHLSLSQFLAVRELWQTTTLDWYLAGNLRALSLRLGGEKLLPLSEHFSLGLGLHGAAAEVSLGTGEIASDAPSRPGAPPGPDPSEELRANQWLFGLGGTVSLVFLTESPFFARLQGGYTQYTQKARHFEALGRDFTPEGFSVSLSGPSAGISVGLRL